MSHAIKPKGPRVYTPESGPLYWFDTYLASSVGSKILTALTGLGLATFVVFHMIGNLKMFHGPDAINAYAKFLKHDMGALIWIARGGLLTIFVLHLAVALRLKAKAAAARPVAYACSQTAQASLPSRVMLSTGIVIGVFVLFHLAHFTFAWAHDADLGNGRHINYLELKDSQGRHDVYSMVVAGFKTPWISGIYLLSQAILFAHLAHGVQSALRTLGLVGRRFEPVAKLLGVGLAFTVAAGNVAIVLAVWSGMVAPVVAAVK